MSINENYSEKIAHQLFFNPLSQNVNRLCILTSHASPNMASWLLKTYKEKFIYNVEIELIIANTYNEGIDNLSHEGFVELHKSNSNFSCSYIYKNLSSLDANYYIWLNNDNPILAFSCPCEFTQPSILRERDVHIRSCSARDLYEGIYNEAIDKSIYCNHSEVAEEVIIHSSSHLIQSITYTSSQNSICLSLLMKNGEIGASSGLNWGQRKNRNKNEAYIPLPSNIARSAFFPLNKQHFLVITDDHHTLLLRVEQQNDKAITTPSSNALLGEYFRNRLGLPNGSYIAKEDLIRYGRTNVNFFKIDEEQYYMDFSNTNIIN